MKLSSQCGLRSKDNKNDNDDNISNNDNENYNNNNNNNNNPSPAVAALSAAIAPRSQPGSTHEALLAARPETQRLNDDDNHIIKRAW